ncbi:hypothetical protein [Armatimonas sp.]|uniref:hypothetical protein n=1 Tax=Armatimonas sp. TaxID=1872638 RepID=UPI003752DAD9
MPITTISGFQITLANVATHWARVDDDLASAALELKGGYTLAKLTADQTAVAALIQKVDSSVLILATLASKRDQLKEKLRPRLTQFRGAVKSALDGTPYAKTLPTLPLATADMAGTLKPFTEMETLWERINTDEGDDAIVGGLRLARGYDLASFKTELAMLQSVYKQISLLEQTLAVDRRTRDTLRSEIVTRLRQYKNAVIARYDTDHPLLATVPGLYPTGGSTPDGVTLSGHWSRDLTCAQLAWTASNNDQLDHYSIRAAPLPAYSTRNEAVVAMVSPGTLTWHGELGLTEVGEGVVLKVYVVTKTGNEKGSNVVKVVREA